MLGGFLFLLFTASEMIRETAALCYRTYTVRCVFMFTDLLSGDVTRYLITQLNYAA